MKIQISRDGFRADKRYSGVYQQQGRMITDRDWNELVDILKTRLDEGLADVVGNGLPRGRAVELRKGAQGLEIRPGVVYAGGVAARVASVYEPTVHFGYDQQFVDFPSPPALPSNQPYVVYADVWERPVSALEDEGLRDPALNGADTAARTQTMAQIKWAPSGRDPENTGQNPSRGNGTLSVSVPAASSGDPLGGTDAVGGDYLLRLEVHDVTWASGASPDAPGRIVVKWSRENGAEQHKALEAPSSFKSGPWIYELYELASEKSLGYSFSTSWQPPRGALFTTFPFLTPQNHHSHLLRRWDGYCVLYRQSNNTWTFSPNQPEDPKRTAPGATLLIDNGRLLVRLLDLELILDLQGKTFLAGDYWQVPVRRAIHQPGTTIVQAAPPAGILHRYVTLASVSATGDVTPRATFPPLTALQAGDVGYDGSGCTSGLFDASHNTVKKALDRLWSLAAEHSAYAKPADTSLYKGKTIANVKNALDLLSDVRARQIVYEGRTGVPDVQTALETLYARPSSDPSGYTVGTGGEFANIDTAIQTLMTQQKQDIRLVLLPGDHVLGLSPIFLIDRNVHLTFTGVGWASRLIINKGISILSPASLTFQGLHIEFQGTGYLSFQFGEVSFLDNRISGISKEGLIRPYYCPRILFRDNLVEVTDIDPTLEPVAIIAPLDTEASIRELFSTRSPRLFALRANVIDDRIAALSEAERLQRSDAIQTQLNKFPDLPKAAYNTFLINFRNGGRGFLNNTLSAVRAEAVQRALPGHFLRLDDSRASVRLESNQIFGYVSLYGAPGGTDLSYTDLRNFSVQVSNALFDSQARHDLIVTGNRMSGFRVSSGTLSSIRTGTHVDPLFQRITLTDNTFEAGGNQLVACNVELTSNLYTAPAFGWAIGEEVLMMSNVARIDVGFDVVTRNLVSTGNSTRMKIRRITPSSPATP